MRQTKHGFTLVELLLYLSIAATLILVIAIFWQSLLEARVKNQAVSEVGEQGRAVEQFIAQTIRNAEGINAPSQGASAATSSINVVTAANDPTIFDSSNGALRIQEGANSPISLTNSRVTISNLSFYNLTRTGTPGVMRVIFTLNYVNPTNRNEYEYSKTFRVSAALR